jgi:hypothetical protein
MRAHQEDNHNWHSGFYEWGPGQPAIVCDEKTGKRHAEFLIRMPFVQKDEDELYPCEIRIIILADKQSGDMLEWHVEGLVE